METPHVDGFWSAFANLPPQDRHKFLEKLVTQLAPQELSQLGRLLPNVYCYSRDLLPTLPLELVLHITSYIEPLQLVRCRRVNRNWNQLFSGDAVCGPALKRHFPADAGLLLDPESIYHGKSERWAFENSLSRHVFTNAFVVASFHTDERLRYWREYQYIDGSVSLVSCSPFATEDTIQIVNIDVENKYEIVAAPVLPEREDCNRLFYSSSFALVFTFLPYFYVYNVEKATFRKLHWPSMAYRHPHDVAADGGVFVMMYNTEVVVVHAETGTYQICDSPCRHKAPRWAGDLEDIGAVSIDSSARTFAIVGMHPDSSDVIRYAEYSIDNRKLLSLSDIRLPFLGFALPGENQYIQANTLCGPGIKRIYSYATMKVNGLMPVEDPKTGISIYIGSLFFDFNSKKLMYQKIRIPARGYDKTVDRLVTMGNTNFVDYGDVTYGFAAEPKDIDGVWEALKDEDMPLTEVIVPNVVMKPLFRNFTTEHIFTDRNGRTILAGFAGQPNFDTELSFGVVRGVHDWNSEQWRERLKNNGPKYT